MLESLELKNFRGFEEHEVALNPLTIIVGQNNAGKSTIVEALRLISMVVERYRFINYRRVPDWLEIPKSYYGVAPSLKNTGIDFVGIFHQYSDPPAIITASFKNRSSIKIYLGGEDDIHAVIRDPRGQVIKTKQQAVELDLPSVRIMPQVAPVQREETILTADYLRRTMSSSLAPLHFRNQLNLFYDQFDEFRSVVERTWPGVMVKELIGRGEFFGKPLALLVRNEDFVAETSLMGHGLQMWLQTMWFLTMAKSAHTVILDEPDVYMHPDLQRRLIRFLRSRFGQVILTTHSIEIMSEVDPEEILVVDKRRPTSKFANSLGAVQTIIDKIGSAHNIHLARLWSSRCLILVEGDDLKILQKFQNILFPRSNHPFDSIPNMPIGGWGGWNYAVGSSMLLMNAFGENIGTYCILDSDYHTEDEIIERYKVAQSHGVNLHIWSRKEIENYLLVPSVIQRLIVKRKRKNIEDPTVDEIERKITELADGMEEEVLDGFTEEIYKRDKPRGPGRAGRMARKIVKHHRENQDGIQHIVSGKLLISKLSEWSKAQFGAQLNVLAIAKEMYPEEVPEEVKEVISSIEECLPLKKISYQR